MKRRLSRPDEGAKRGVALIVVLGFLSIMIVMAVAFLTQARIERLVADATMAAQRGRQMARTALNAAMSDYSYQLYEKNKLMLPPKDSDFDLFLSKKPYASGEIQPALAGNNGTLNADARELMKGEARNWIPRRYLEDEDYAMQNTHWILVRQDPSKGPAVDNPIVGRYAYLCFDMSGGIDANLIALTEGVANVGNATNRFSVRDVGLRELKEMLPIQGLEDTPPDASLFKRLRRGWHGFDTLSELILLTNGRYNGGENEQAVKIGGVIYYYIDEGVSAEELPPSKVWGPPGSDARWRAGEGWTRIEQAAPALNSTNVSDLVPYSLATFRGWEYNPNTAMWNADHLVAWDEHGTWDAANWEIALGDLENQFKGGAIPAWWEQAVTDYASSENYPVGVNYPSPKNVPMINEVSLRVAPQVNVGGTNELNIEVEMQVEVWFPFPADDNKRTESYTLAPTIGGGPTPTGPAGVDVWIPMRGNGGAYKVPAWTASPQSAPPFTVSYGDGLPKVKIFTYSVIVPVEMANTNQALDSTTPLQIQVTTGKGIEIQTGGNAVDWMPAEALNLRRDAGSTLPLVASAAAAATYYWEAFDPRLNHLNEEGWELGDGTMGQINKAAKSRGYGTNGDSTNFYCRNAPMISPVEAGYINTGNPWKTLEFCSKEGADALSRMVSRKMIDDLDVVGVAYTNGTINPNTSSSNVLRTAFADLKIKDNNTALDDVDLTELVTIFSGITASKKITDNSSATVFSGACMRGIDWIWAAPFKPDGYYGTKWSKNERHRLIGRTWGLFNPNNSMFTILAIGQSIKEGPGQMGAWSADDVITGERRAVAMVWRDPTPPGLKKPHEMFTRVFKFLDE
ncbi:MAG: hypothetical protein EOM72_05415 [Opitutae bacterium]|nr:hypothetical protein [Opitutae bacterium]